MKIKRYTAPSMRAALALVRAEQGPDAVILSSRRGEDGIEVIAAVDYDEALFVDLHRQRTRPPAIASAPDPAAAETIPSAPPAVQAAARAPAPALASARAPVPAPARVPVPASTSTSARATARAPVHAPAPVRS